MIELTTEQEFKIHAFKLQVESMNDEQIKSMLVKIHERIIVADTLYMREIKKRWGLDAPDATVLPESLG